MNKRETEAFKHFIKAYDYQWEMNHEYREQYDDDLEYYIGYRDPSKYPLAYNMTFPQLLPRIMTMLGRMLEQVYQGGSHDLVSVRPRKRSDVERAPRVQGLLNYQLENLNSLDVAGSSYMFNYQWMNNALSWGKGIAKCYWKKEERIAPKRVQFQLPKFDERTGQVVGFETKSVTVNEPQIIYDAPYTEVIHNKSFVPDPRYKSIQQMPFVFCVYKKSVDYLHEMQKKGIYKNVKELGWNSGSGASHNAVGTDSAEQYVKSLSLESYAEMGDLESNRMAPQVDVIEGYGKYIFPGDDSPYEVGSGVKIKGKESEAIIHIGNYKTVLSIQKNTYGFRPFFAIGAYPHPELFWDMGIIRLGKPLQEQYDTMNNTRFQNAIMSVNQMLQVRKDSDIPPESLIWKPFGLIPVDEINQDVAPLLTPDVSQTGIFREQEEFFKSTIEDMTGMPRYNMGATPTRQEHVGTIHSLQAMGESRVKLLLMTMDYQGFQPLLKYMMQLNTWHLPDDFEARIITRDGEQFSPMFAGDIHSDYDFSARYTSMEPALGKQFRIQNLLQLNSVWAQSPYLQQHQWMKSIMELMDFADSDKYLKSPEQLQQEQQQAMQQQVQAEMAQASMQDNLSANQQQREMSRDIMKGLLKG